MDQHPFNVSRKFHCYLIALLLLLYIYGTLPLSFKVLLLLLLSSPSTLVVEKKNEWFCRAEAISFVGSFPFFFFFLSLIFYECHTIFVHFHHFLMIPHLFLTFKVSLRWLLNIHLKLLVKGENFFFRLHNFLEVKVNWILKLFY